MDQGEREREQIKRLSLGADTHTQAVPLTGDRFNIRTVYVAGGAGEAAIRTGMQRPQRQHMRLHADDII